MISLRPIAALMLMATNANAAAIPLKPGAYVLAGTPCKDPPFAAMFSFDGKRFSYPHASDCRATVLAHHGPRYRIAETCSALGDGTSATPTTMTSTYIFESPTQLGIIKTRGHAALRYRWCVAQRAHQDERKLNIRDGRHA